MFSSLPCGDAALPRRKPLASRTAGDEVFVRDSVSGQIHFLSPSAAAIWNCCDGHTTLDACVQRIRDQFAVPEDSNIAEDVRVAIADFTNLGLLQFD